MCAELRGSTDSVCCSVCCQVISQCSAAGEVVVGELKDMQGQVFNAPVVVLAQHLGGKSREGGAWGEGGQEEGYSSRQHRGLYLAAGGGGVVTGSKLVADGYAGICLGV